MYKRQIRHVQERQQYSVVSTVIKDSLESFSECTGVSNVVEVGRKSVPGGWATVGETSFSKSSSFSWQNVIRCGLLLLLIHVAWLCVCHSSEPCVSWHRGCWALSASLLLRAVLRRSCCWPPAADRAAIDRYLLAARPTAANQGPGARFTKYLTTILRLPYDNAKLTIDLRRTSNLSNIRKTQR